jgi:hypothetical protein
MLVTIFDPAVPPHSALVPTNVFGTTFNFGGVAAPMLAAENAAHTPNPITVRPTLYMKYLPVPQRVDMTRAVIE